MISLSAKTVIKIGNLVDYSQAEHGMELIA